MVKRTAIEIKGLIEKPEKEKYQRGKLGLVFCKECNAVYYKKSWHHNLRYYKNLRENLAIRFSICPACRMIKNRQFEGEIIIQNIPSKIYDDLVNLVKSFSHRAYQRDPMDRLIKIEKISVNPCLPAGRRVSNQRLSASTVRITTTENQLAVKLAKKIKDVFKKVKMKISYSPAPSDVVYIKITFN